jgi:hypothetical protein
MPIMFNTPGFSQEVGALGATLWATYYLAIVFGAVLLRNRLLSELAARPPQVRQIAARVPVTAVGALIVAGAALCLVDRGPDRALAASPQDDRQGTVESAPESAPAPTPLEAAVPAAPPTDATGPGQSVVAAPGS